MYLKYLSLRFYPLFSFQFCTRLASVFAEEVGDFGMTFGHIQRCAAIFHLNIHIFTFGDQQFDDFFVTSFSRIMQRSEPSIIFHIHIRTSSQVLLDGFDIS